MTAEFSNILARHIVEHSTFHAVYCTNNIILHDAFIYKKVEINILLMSELATSQVKI